MASLDDFKAALRAKLEQIYDQVSDRLLVDALSELLDTCALSSVRLRVRVVLFVFAQFACHTVSMHAIL